jgi:hypothetical protein
VHLVHFLEVLLQGGIELLGPMARHAIEIGSVAIEIVPLPVRREHHPQARRVAGSFRTRKCLDERDRRAVCARMEGADVEFLRRLVFEHKSYHRVLRIGHVGEERFFPRRLIGDDGGNLVAG